MSRLTKEDRQYRRRVCGRKKRFVDWYEARAVADKMEVKCGALMNVYECRVCGQLHIGGVRGYYADGLSGSGDEGR